MGRPFPLRTLAILVTAALLSGCAGKPEKPIVLRRPATERRPAARKVVPSPPPASAPATEAATSGPGGAEPATSLTPEQKERLFRDFDRYLARPAL